MFDGEVRKFRVVLAGETQLSVEGVRKILSVTEERVALRLAGRILTVEGKGISIAAIQRGFLVLSGRFTGILLSGTEERS